MSIAYVLGQLVPRHHALDLRHVNATLGSQRMPVGHRSTTTKGRCHPPGAGEGVGKGGELTLFEPTYRS